MTDNILVKGTIEGVRIYAIKATSIVEELRKIHNCSPLAIAALGRTILGALLFSATMKEKERVTIRIKGDGPLGEIIADAKGGCVRGYIDNPEVMLPPKNGKLDVGGGVGVGNIIVTRYLANCEPFNGYCELVNGEIATDLTNYLFTSEQTPASVALGVLVYKTGAVIEAGGYFIQAMPGAKDEVLKKLEDNIIGLPYVTELLKAGFTPEQIIEKIGEGFKVSIKDTEKVELKCECSREKVLGMLAALSEKDREEIGQDEQTEVHCHFCNKSYKFPSSEILTLNDKKSEKNT